MKRAGNFIDVFTGSVINPLRILAIGDSIVANGYGQNGIYDYVLNSDDLANGATISSQAVQGADINNQRDFFLADPNKATYDVIFMQIAINNLGGGGDYDGTYFQYQRFVNDLKSNGKAGLILILSLMTPARELLITRGNAQEYWEQLNADIAGISSTPITGADGVVTQHVGIIGDSQYNIKPQYKISGMDDGIHINNSAKSIIGGLWRDKLLQIQ